MKKWNRGRLKKLLSTVLAAALLAPALSLSGTTASAADMVGAYFTAGDPAFAYVITGIRALNGDNTVELYQNEDMQSYADYSGEYAIPSKVYNPRDMVSYTVAELGGGNATGTVLGALQNVPLRAVSLPGTVKKVGVRAFAGCYNLAEVVFPSSVTELAFDAFTGTNLQKFTLDVVTETTLTGNSSYTSAGRSVPVTLPCAVTDLNVRSPLSVNGQVLIPGETVVSGSRITLESGAYLTLQGPLSGAGVIQVMNNATLVLQSSSSAYTGTVRLTGDVSTLINSTSSSVTVVDASGKTVVVKPGESRTGGQKEEEPPADDPSPNHPQITTNHGGSVAVQEDGKVVVITASEGYRVEEVVINGLPMGSLTRYEFETASAQNTVAVTFSKGQDQQGPDQPVIDPVFRFTDVSPTAPYAEAVSFLANNGIFQGVTKTQFAPNRRITRAMFASLLQRLEVYGEDFQLECKTPYSAYDALDAWYSDAASWAMGTGILSSGDYGFHPNRELTRREFALGLYRYTHLRGYATVLERGGNTYSDAASLSTEARKAMTWAIRSGYLSSKGGRFDPSGTMTRAEIAQALARYLRIN